MGHEHVWMVDGKERPRCFALQVADDAPGHVLDIERPLAQVGIVNLAQRFDIAARHFLKDELDVQ